MTMDNVRKKAIFRRTGPGTIPAGLPDGGHSPRRNEGGGVC